MEILRLIESLENLVEHETKLRFLNKAWGVDEDKFFTIINKLRAALPEEVKKASRVTRESERIIAEAQEQANRVLQEAKEQSQVLVSNDEITRAATRQADDIIRRAREEAEQAKAEVDAYAARVLANAEAFLNRMLGSVQKAREQVDAGGGAE